MTKFALPRSTSLFDPKGAVYESTGSPLAGQPGAPDPSGFNATIDCDQTVGGALGPSPVMAKSFCVKGSKVTPARPQMPAPCVGQTTCVELLLHAMLKTFCALVPKLSVVSSP